jgi:hypothetical protein
MTEADTFEGLARNADHLYYACRPYDGDRFRAGLVAMKCQQCGQRIMATADVLTAKRRWARSIECELIVACDECTLAAAERAGALVAKVAEETP